MQRRYITLLGIIIAVVLLCLAAAYYPGGSQANSKSTGYSWKDNYISNLFGEKAVNGEINHGRYFAVAGMMFLAVAFGIFFIGFSKNIPNKSGAVVVKYFGAAGMFFTALIATPLHDTMITFSSIFFLLSMFYITVFVFKSKLTTFKWLCVIYLLIFYATMYIYGAGTLREYLPVFQKVLFVSTIGLVLALDFFARKEDFQSNNSRP